MQRFAAKSLQTKGIRFRCRLCSEMAGTKAAANEHFRRAHTTDLQAFKKQKSPQLFQERSKQGTAGERKISFARDDVLRKRPADTEQSFGGFAKKEKPAPPPCETEEYQQQMQEPIFTAPPWANKSRPSDEDATEMDREVDRRVQEAQQRRFSKRNILEVNATTVRCKLCYKTLGSTAEADRHIGETHKEDFLKEMQMWERFLFTTCRRQPPFGWVCKVCNIFFPSDGAVWRHLGKEVFVRQEERHLEHWQQKEDRWGHEEDEECCGDGMNISSGLSYDSVRRLHEETNRLQEEQMAKEMDGTQGKEESESEAEEEEEAAEEPAKEEVKFIEEF